MTNKKEHASRKQDVQVRIALSKASHKKGKDHGGKMYFEKRMMSKSNPWCCLAMSFLHKSKLMLPPPLLHILLQLTPFLYDNMSLKSLLFYPSSIQKRAN